MASTRVHELVDLPPPQLPRQSRQQPAAPEHDPGAAVQRPLRQHHRAQRPTTVSNILAVGTYITPPHEHDYLIIRVLQCCLLSSVKAHCKGHILMLWCSIYRVQQHATPQAAHIMHMMHGLLRVFIPGMKTVVAKFPSWCGNCLTPCRVLPGNGSAEVWPPSAAPCRMRFAGLQQQLAAVFQTAQHIIHHASSDRERFHLMLECAPVIPHYCCALRCLGVQRHVGWTLLQGVGVRTRCCCFVVTVWHEAFNHARYTAQQSLWTQLQTAVPRTTGGAGCLDDKRHADMRGARATHMNAKTGTQS